MARRQGNLILEHLRPIRSQIADDVGDLKQRISGLESAMNLVRREVGLADEVDARQQKVTLHNQHGYKVMR